jgi:hypothetical protein
MGIVRIVLWVARIVGVVTLLLGLLRWITGMVDLVPFHKLSGLTFTLSLLVLSCVLVFTRGGRLLVPPTLRSW